MTHRTDPSYSGIAEIGPYAVVELDDGGRIIGWNAGAQRLTGHDASAALGTPLTDLLPHDPSELSANLLSRVAEGGSEYGLWMVRADGTHFWGKLAAARSPAPARGHTIVFRDATAIKLVRDELERSRTIFENILAIASDAVVCVDETQRIVFFNEGAQRMFGYGPDEALGQPLEMLIPGRFRGDHADRVEEFGAAPVAARQMGERGSIAGLRKNGEEFPAEASISKLEVGNGRIYTAVLRDVTERRRAEEALARQAEELSRSNSDLEQFAYVASHDLQEPLRMVASYTQLLARRYRGKLDEDADEFIGFAVDGVTRMQALINDLLAYSRVGTRGGDLSDVSMETTLQRVLVSLGPTLEETGAEITHDPLPVVTGDRTQLTQLLQNLIQNGIKFHAPGHPPRVHVGVEDTGAMWHFRVQDNGIGIAPEFQERIFVIFQRLHSRDEYAGTGIGLAICKKIVERHGGRIWVESKAGEGATFHFTLPRGSND